MIRAYHFVGDESKRAAARAAARDAAKNRFKTAVDTKFAEMGAMP